MSDDEDWALTDERIAKLEARVAACPCPQSAYCPDEVSSLRFELHIVAAKALADLRAARARLAEVELSEDAKELLATFVSIRPDAWTDSECRLAVKLLRNLLGRCSDCDPSFGCFGNPGRCRKAVPMDPICPRCAGKHGIEVSGDGYEWDCAACGGHLICAIGPDGGEMFSWHREDGTCGCNNEPHTCELDDEARADLLAEYAESETP